LALVFVFLVFCVSWYFLGYFYFKLLVPVQLIACEDRPWNNLLCIKRDVNHLLTHSLTSCSYVL